MFATPEDETGTGTATEKSKAANKATTEKEFEVRLKDGTPLAEAISGVQKMIRRGKVKEAVVLAYGMWEANFGKSLARRLPVIAAEDIGLANPTLVASVHTICMTWIAMQKEIGSA